MSKPKRWRASCCLVLTLCCAPSATSLAQSTPVNDERAQLRAHLRETIELSSGFDDRFEAEVWFVDMQRRLSAFIDNAKNRLALLRMVHSEASAADLPPELVLALIEVESAFDRYAVSKAGAQGYMQVMPFWKDELGRSSDNLTDPQTNLRYGCRILQYYLQRERGHLEQALAAYNGSLGKTWYSDRVYDAWIKHWRTTPLPWRGSAPE